MHTPRLIAGLNSSIVSCLILLSETGVVSISRLAKAGPIVENVQISRSDLSNLLPRQNAIRPPTDS